LCSFLGALDRCLEPRPALDCCPLRPLGLLVELVTADVLGRDGVTDGAVVIVDPVTDVLMLVVGLE
jgi:hypothetical protein